MSEKKDINLVQKTADHSQQTCKLLWLIQLGVFVALGMLYTAGTVYVKNIERNVLNYEELVQEFDKEVTVFNTTRKDGDALQKQLYNLGILLDNRVSPTSAIDFIFSLVDKDVIFTTIDFDLGLGTIQLEGIAKNYEAVARQIVTLQTNKHIIQADFDNVMVNNENADMGAQQGPIGVRFQTKIMLRPFAKSP